MLLALAGFMDRRMRTAAGYLGMRGVAHTVTDRGEPALEVWQDGLTNALLCVRRGCAPGQRCSQRADTCTPSSPRARGTITVPTAYHRSQMVAVHGRPGHIWSRVGDFGIAFFNLWAGWPGGSPAWTHSSYTPIQPHNPDLNIVLGICVCAS